MQTCKPLDKKSVQNKFKKLLLNNKKFVEAGRFSKMRDKTEEKQKPPFCIVSCSDSRVDVHNIMKKANIGFFYEIKTMGNTLCETDMENIRYAVKVLRVKCVIVLAHTNCDAIKYYIDSKLEESKVVNPRVTELLDVNLSDKLAKTQKNISNEKKDMLLDECIQHNLLKNALLLEDDKIIKRVPVIAMLYNIKTGELGCVRK